MTYVIRKRGIDKSQFPRKEEILQRVCEVMELARNEFPAFTLCNFEVPVVFVNTGQAAGMMQWFTKPGHDTVYNLLFNTVAIKNGWDHMMNETIPHEIAHLVERSIYGNVNASHGPSWKRIAKRLGCSAQRCHNIDMSESKRKSRKAVYIASCGTTVNLTINMHNKVQRGQQRQLSNTKGKIHAEHFTGRVVTA